MLVLTFVLAAVLIGTLALVFLRGAALPQPESRADHYDRVTTRR